MEIPIAVMELLCRLETAGYCAVAVGGCVRDLLLGKTPADWDVATDATPTQVHAVFSDHRVIETGVRYGTMTVSYEGLLIEVTTFRSDKPSVDGRHPTAVVFGKSLREDCSRRDFTVNALCLDAHYKFYDYYGGLQDLKQRTIRCIGDPSLRFEEDALRILRALRFACCLGFVVEKETAEAMCLKKGLLKRLSAERVFGELSLLLNAPGCADMVLAFADVLHTILPVSLFQHPMNPTQQGVISAIDRLPVDAALRLALIFWYPPCDCIDDARYATADGILRGLRAPNLIRHNVLGILSAASRILSADDSQLLKILSGVLMPVLKDALLLLDAVAASTQNPVMVESAASARARLDALHAKHLCLTVKDLAVTGRDLLALGIPEGPLVGQMQKEMLNQVLMCQLPNRRDALLRWTADRLLFKH